MQLRPFAEEHQCEFAVNHAGKALLFHVGALKNSYSWLQYDSVVDRIQLITESGSIQDLGLSVPDQLKSAIQSTNQITFIEINGNNSCQRQMRVVFNTVLR